jgi:hypothetical protein
MNYDWNFTPHCPYQGLYDVVAQVWRVYSEDCQTGYNNHYVTRCTGGCDPNVDVSNDGNWMVFGLRAHLATVGYTNYISQSGVTLNGALMFARDQHNPWIQSVDQNAPSYWVNSATLYAIPTATDRGLGINTVTLRRPGLPDWERTNQCAGTYASPCPDYANPNASLRTYAPRFDYSTDTLPEGVQTVSAVPIDVVNNGGPAAGWQVKIDRSNPGRFVRLADLLARRIFRCAAEPDLHDPGCVRPRCIQPRELERLGDRRDRWIVEHRRRARG